jgi:hypothetical protein
VQEPSALMGARRRGASHQAGPPPLLRFGEARKLAQALSLPSQLAWVECCHSRGLPPQ